ncbi:MAG TPA: septum site-determining protein MinC [Candidatus Dormibacteraeota bacterium]|nr:septum site-determining protein MinC [Candidatus Dormibacteraeota bacterium]
MPIVRGTRNGLEFDLFEAPLAEVLPEIRDKLGASPEFYRGADGVLSFGDAAPAADALEALLALLAEFAIRPVGTRGGPAIAELSERSGLAYLGPLRRGGAKVRHLSAAARSTEADFAGARADLAHRRLRAVREPAAAAAVPEPGASAAETVLHRGTLRGGQAIRHRGSIVVLGDVNPGSELVATGDIVVIGALRGVAHAGAQGDAAACVFALDLSPTQLRIGSHIAVAPEGERRRAPQPELARVEDGRIVIVPYTPPR